MLKLISQISTWPKKLLSVWKIAIFVLGASTSVLVFQNCGKGFQVNDAYITVGSSVNQNADGNLEVPVFFNNLSSTSETQESTKFIWQVDPAESNATSNLETTGGEISVNLTTGQFRIPLKLKPGYTPKENDFITIVISEISGKVISFRQKVVLNLPSKISGAWGPWSDWSPCSLSCGGGQQIRNRTCNNPAPRGGGENCTGDAQESRSCSMQACAINGGWSEYSEWSACSAACGGGTRTRTRTCNQPPPSNGGAACVGNTVQTETCNLNACTTPVLNPINGAWSEWVTVGSCSKTCGTGVQNYSRTCTNPAPANGGAPCSGLNTKQESCNTQLCPVDGGWSIWSDWTECSSNQCGTNGEKSHTRLCNNPVPSSGGKMCVGDSIEKQTCTPVCSSPVETTTNPQITGIAVNTDYICVVMNNSKIYCHGKIFNYDFVNRVEVSLPVGTQISSIHSGFGATCFISGGQVYCFGERIYSYTGYPIGPKSPNVWGTYNTTSKKIIPDRVDFGLTNIKKLEFSVLFQCALSTAGSAVCKGYFPSELSVWENRTGPVYLRPGQVRAANAAASQWYNYLGSGNREPSYGYYYFRLSTTPEVRFESNNFKDITLYPGSLCGLTATEGVKCFGFVQNGENAWWSFGAPFCDLPEGCPYASIINGVPPFYSGGFANLSTGLPLRNSTDFSYFNSSGGMGYLAIQNNTLKIITPSSSNYRSIDFISGINSAPKSSFTGYGEQGPIACAFIENRLDCAKYNWNFINYAAVGPLYEDLTGSISSSFRIPDISSISSGPATCYSTTNNKIFCNKQYARYIFGSSAIESPTDYIITEPMLSISNEFWKLPVDTTPKIACLLELTMQTIGGTPLKQIYRFLPDETKILYSTNAYPFGASPTGYQQERKCDGNTGIVSGDNYHVHLWINQLPGASCPLVDGRTIAHGITQNTYKANDPSCTTKARYCYNGSLNGDTTYNYGECPNPQVDNSSQDSGSTGGGA